MDDVVGVNMVNWNVNTQEVKVLLSSSELCEGELQRVVAKVGHDTNAVKASDDVYAALPDCCKYPRNK